MINLKWARGNKELFITKMLERGVKEIFLNQFFEIQEKVRDLEREINTLRQQRNLLSSDNNFKEIEGEARDVRKKIQEKNEIYENLSREMEEQARWFPNLLNEDVPIGRDESENVEIRVWNSNLVKERKKTHDEFLDKKLVEQTHIMSAARFTGISGKMAILHRAIGSFTLDLLGEEGFTEHCLPYLLNPEAMTGSGHLPFFTEDLFWLDNKKLALIPTSEVSIANLMKDRLYNLQELPLKICSYSPCFRREAGAAGRDTKGLKRLHQFHKVEMFMVTPAEDSEKAHQYMVSLAEKALQKLNLSYRVLLLCSGDTGFHSSKTYDLEVWMPAIGKYMEISSCSNVKDFQSNRLGARYKLGNEKGIIHSLNGSCLPIERTIAAIIENYQIEDNIIAIPEVLQKYTGFSQFTI